MDKIKSGKVTTVKSSKTITVSVSRRKKHPLYDKPYLVTKKFHVHDEKNQAQIGDLVEIVESRPKSKTKRWALKAVLEKADK